MQVANFLASGGLLLAFALGTRRAEHRSTSSGRLMGVIGLGLIGAGIFACDPIGGYPPGTPPRPESASLRGALHQLFSSFVFLGLPALLVNEARHTRNCWPVYSTATCVMFLGSFAISSAGFAQTPGLVRVGGLFQRLALSAGFLWLTARAARLLRELDANE